MSFTKLLSFVIYTSVFFASDVVANKKGDSPDRDFGSFENVSESQPLWELGVGSGAVDVPNYPASGERNFVPFVVPYLVYRGDIFRASGNSGVRAVVLETSDFELGLSFGGAFSADSDDNSVRAGMPELDFLFEVGPQLIYRVKDYEFKHGGNARLKARLQARAVYSTDFERVDERGFVVEPMLSYQQRGVFFEDSSVNAGLSFKFASEELQDYYYQVDPVFANSNRMQYDAKGGYLGAELSLGFSFPVREKIRGFLGGSAQFHQGAANRGSPLYEEDITYSVGLRFVWRLFESEAKANW
ncbi:MAG: MltA-interacting MipA family protein [Alteromonadaceae bacterium]|nr:MAG: MltA-interacting MipA family protein [Alteromonadaceae bacterium]